MPASTVCLTFDFDALSVWFGFDHVTPAMLQRGEYGARVGVPRLLQMLEREDVKATFFIPGHTVDSFPDQCRAILAAGHEIAAHSYAHQDPSGQSEMDERRDMEKALDALDRIGVRPLGYRSPSADMSPVTLDILEAHGFLYDSSLMADDFRPYRPRIGDSVTADRPLERGREADLWELPMSFELDDWPHFQFTFSPYRAGLSAASKVLEIWQAEFDFMDRELDGGVLNVCMHPQVIGRGHRVLMLEAFIAHCRAAGATFSTCADVAWSLPIPGFGPRRISTKGFQSLFVDQEHRFGLVLDADSGRTFVSFPVSNPYAEYLEWYEVDRETFDRFVADPASALPFVEKAKNRELDRLLLYRPGTIRGYP